MIHIYTGRGKGKTTAALGLALRAKGQGKKILILQFMKRFNYGEHKAVRQMDDIEIVQFGTGDFIHKENLSKTDFEEARKGWEYFEQALKDKKYDLIILDEINLVLDFKLLNMERVEKIIQQYRNSTELVFTGRNCPGRIIQKADYVTEMLDIKHPYEKGVGAREGIEY